MSLWTFKQAYQKLRAGQLSRKDVEAYLQFLWRVNFPFLTRRWVKDTIVWRQGRIKCIHQCKYCGCEIPGLEYSDKQCGGSCYPPMDYKFWKTMKSGHWKEPHIDLGEIKGGQTVELEFEYTGPAGPWMGNGKPSVSSSCGCTAPVWEDGKLKVKFTPKPVPRTSPEPSYPTTKSVHILMDEGGTEPVRHTLTLSAVVHD